MRRTLIIVITAIIIIASLSGCNFFSNKDSVNMLVLFKSSIGTYEEFVEKLEKDKNINLNISYLLNDEEDEYFEIKDLWSEIELKINEKLNDEDVDIIAGIPTPYLYKPIQKGQLESFNPYLSNGELTTSDIYEPIVNISKKVGNNEIYFLPPAFNNKMLIINNDIFNRLNIKIPDKQLTWSEVYDLSLETKSKITDLDNIYPISLGPGAKSGLFMDFELLTSIKNLPLLENSTKIYNNEEWFSLLDQFIKIFQTNGGNADLDSIDDMFFQGKVAMKILYPVDLNVLGGIYSSQDLGFKVEDFDYSILPAPVFDDNRDMAYIDAKNIAISKKSKKKDLAWETVEYALSKEYAVFMANSNRNPFEGKFTSYKDNEILKIYSKKYKRLDPEVIYSGKEGPTKPEDFTEEKYTYYHELARKYFPEMIENKLSVSAGMEKIKSEFEKKFKNN